MVETAVIRDRELLGLIAELGRAGRGLQQGEVFCEGVTFIQFHILDQVDQAGRLPLSQLHEVLAVDKSTTTRLVAPLMEKGLVRRERCCADSRARELVLTPAGAEVLEKVWHCVAHVLEAVRRALPDHEREQVLASVKTFMSVLRRVCGPGCC